MSQINQRKNEHVNIILQDMDIDRNCAQFEDIHLQHRALPQLDFNTIDTRCHFLDKELSFPFLISSMTGGQDQQLMSINQTFAEIAEELQIAMGVGSQRAMIDNQQAKKSFQLRKIAPTIPLIANIGAVQLNYQLTHQDILQFIETLQADALYLHFNPLQEAIQPEGDTNFQRLAEKIADLANQLPIPIIAKEVGCGFSSTDLELLIQCGIRWVDVAGRGGTSWSRVENHRRVEQGNEDNLGLIFQDWGIPTPVAIKNAAKYDNLNIIASGGLRNGIDIAKSIILGAKMSGMAAPLIKTFFNDRPQVSKQIQNFREQLKVAMFLLGCQNIQQLHGNHQLILS